MCWFRAGALKRCEGGWAFCKFSKVDVTTEHMEIDLFAWLLPLNSAV
jgi:hypothetical protein